eukprot:gene14064-biopygen14148
MWSEVDVGGGRAGACGAGLWEKRRCPRPVHVWPAPVPRACCLHGLGDAPLLHAADERLLHHVHNVVCLALFLAHAGKNERGRGPDAAGRGSHDRNQRNGRGPDVNSVVPPWGQMVRRGGPLAHFDPIYPMGKRPGLARRGCPFPTAAALAKRTRRSAWRAQRCIIL